MTDLEFTYKVPDLHRKDIQLMVVIAQVLKDLGDTKGLYPDEKAAFYSWVSDIAKHEHEFWSDK